MHQLTESPCWKRPCAIALLDSHSLAMILTRFQHQTHTPAPSDTLQEEEEEKGLESTLVFRTMLQGLCWHCRSSSLSPALFFWQPKAASSVDVCLSRWEMAANLAKSSRRPRGAPDLGTAPGIRSDFLSTMPVCGSRSPTSKQWKHSRKSAEKLDDWKSLSFVF